MSDFLKAERIVSVGLQLLTRQVVLPGMVWRDAAGDFAGAKNDTISIRLPAFAKAKTRALRSGQTRDRDNLYERKVDVTLDTDIYKDIRITDEQLTLDIADFGAQVLNPVVESIGRAVEDALVAEMQGATYQTELDLDETNPYKTLVAARKALQDARVPMTGLVVACGSTVEAAFLNSEQFARADRSGWTGTLREGAIGRVAGFDVVPVPGLDPEEAYAFHRTAYVLSSRAPIVPAGAPYGASAAANGFAIRVVRVLDSESIEDILATDCWVGTNVVTDFGTVTDGVFEPSEGSADSGSSDFDSGADDLFVRSVKISIASSS